VKSKAKCIQNRVIKIIAALDAQNMRRRDESYREACEKTLIAVSGSFRLKEPFRPHMLFGDRRKVVGQIFGSRHGVRIAAREPIHRKRVEGADAAGRDARGL
jgi:hypothetical protein